MAPAVVWLDFLFYKIVSCSWGTCCTQYLDFSFQLEQWNFMPGQMVHGQLSTYAHIKVNVKSKKTNSSSFIIWRTLFSSCGRVKKTTPCLFYLKETFRLCMEFDKTLCWFFITSHSYSYRKVLIFDIDKTKQKLE